MSSTRPAKRTPTTQWLSSLPGSRATFMDSGRPSRASGSKGSRSTVSRPRTGSTTCSRGSNNLREMGHVKLAEFQLRKDNLKTQYNEKVELIREKSSAGWSQAKEAAKSAKEIAKESAKKKAEAAIKKAELAAVIHAETVED